MNGRGSSKPAVGPLDFYWVLAMVNVRWFGGFGSGFESSQRIPVQEALMALPLPTLFETGLQACTLL